MRQVLKLFLSETTSIHLTMSWVAYYPLHEVAAEMGRRPVIVRWGA